MRRRASATIAGPSRRLLACGSGRGCLSCRAMRAEDVRAQVALRLSTAGTAKLPTSMIGRPARAIVGLAHASTLSLGRALRRRVGRPKPNVDAEAAVVQTIGRLKGVTMKMGQLFGYIDVGLPANLRAALSALHDGAQPLPLDRIAEVI